MQNALPEKADSRQKKRLRSGMCTAAVTAGVLLLLFLLYGVTGRILKSIAERRWQRTIAAAVKSGDTEKTAELLEKCRQEAPYLQQKAIYKKWQKEYLRLLDIKRFRQQEFNKRLTVLQEKLKNPPEDKFLWAEALTMLVSYASCEEEFARVRELEEHCKALEKLRMLKAASAGAKALEILGKDIENLQQLKRQQKWLIFQKNSRVVEKQITGIIIKYAAVPEIVQNAMQIKKTLEELQSAASAAETHAKAEKLHYSKLFTANSEEALRAAIGDFLKRYPRSIYAPELENTLNELQALQHTYREQLDFIVKSMAKNKQIAHNMYRKELDRIIEQELKFGSFELILHTDSNRIVRFETLYQAPFTLQQDGRYVIAFADLDGNQVSGSFNVDGSGWVTTSSGARYQGRIAYGKVAGTLPKSVKQYVLLKLDEFMQNYKDEDFPVFLYFMDQKMNSGKFNLLPIAVKEKLQAARTLAEKHLNAAALQFIFTEEIIKCCRDNTPVFAGIVKSEPEGLLFTPSTAALICDKKATLWLVNSRQNNRFEVLGTWENSRIINTGKSLPTGSKLYIAAISANGADFTELLKKWQKTSSQNQLKMPVLPEFLKK